MGIAHYTNEERKRIESLLKSTQSYDQIGLLMNRSKNSIKNEIIKNGGKKGYTAEASRLRYNEGKVKRSLGLKDFYSKLRTSGNFSPKKKMTLNRRMNLIEDQIKYIIDTLKTLTKEEQSEIG